MNPFHRMGSYRNEGLRNQSESDIPDTDMMDDFESVPASLTGSLAYPAGPLQRRPSWMRDHARRGAAIRRAIQTEARDALRESTKAA